LSDLDSTYRSDGGGLFDQAVFEVDGLAVPPQMIFSSAFE